MRKLTSVIAALCLASGLATAAGIKFVDAEGHWLKIGGRVQLQYHTMDPSTGTSTEEVLLRRLRPYIQGGDESWHAKIQWDMGKSSGDLRDAYFAHTGWSWGTVYVGNYTTPFSREGLTSSKQMQFVERTLAGDHNYGVSDRQAGIHLVGSESDTMTWAMSVAKAAIDPDNGRIDFDTVVSLETGEDWSEGSLVGWRLEYHPQGLAPYAQGDFGDELKTVFGLAGYNWQSDGNNQDAERENKDLEEVTGIELSGGLRGGGFSFDAEYNIIDALLVETDITDGLYQDSRTTLNIFAIKGGYMVLPGKVEVVAGYDTQNADGYDKNWTQTSIGANYFVRNHDIKYQLTYRMGENVDGEAGSDLDELFVQAQYMF